MSILSAVVTEVRIGIHVVDGMAIESGEFGLGVPQVCDLFDVPHKNASRDIKALLGKGFTFFKVKIENTRVTMNAISLKNFEVLAAKLDRKGNVKAQEFRDGLVGVSLDQLFSRAFGQKFEEEDFQRRLIERQLHLKQFHPLYTSWLKADGITTTYGTEVNRFKLTCGLPLICVDQYDQLQLSKLNQAEASYNSLRIAGLSHSKALEIIAISR